MTKQLWSQKELIGLDALKVFWSKTSWSKPTACRNLEQLEPFVMLGYLMSDTYRAQIADESETFMVKLATKSLESSRSSDSVGSHDGIKYCGGSSSSNPGVAGPQICMWR
eukprot:3739353-Karenia_brevis.AAC.1